jgi:hypothetical protein
MTRHVFLFERLILLFVLLRHFISPRFDADIIIDIDPFHYFHYSLLLFRHYRHYFHYDIFMPLILLFLFLLFHYARSPLFHYFAIFIISILFRAMYLSPAHRRAHYFSRASAARCFYFFFLLSLFLCPDDACDD